MDYQLGLPDGNVFEDSTETGPMDFVMGDGSLLQTLEFALLGLKVGDQQTLDIEPQLAFGFPDPAMQQLMTLDQFEHLPPPEAGQIVFFSDTDGSSLPGTVLEVKQGQVLVDFNHPLSGQTVRFTVKILNITNPEYHEE